MKRSTKITLAAAVLVLAIGFAASIVYVAISVIDIRDAAKETATAMVAHDYDAAIKHLTRILEHPLIERASAPFYLQRGTAYINKWQFANARSDLDAALRINPNLPNAHALRAIALQREGQTDKAIVDLDAEIARDPNFASVHYYRGVLLYHAKHDPQRALHAFEEALRADPQKDEAAVLRGKCYAELGDLDRALASFDGAVMLNGKNARAFFERSEVYRRKNEKEKSRADLEESRRLRLEPSRVAGNTPLTPASALEQQARLELLPLPPVEQPPGFEQAAQLLGKTDSAWRAGDLDSAIEAANRVLAMNISPAQASFAVMRRGTAHSSRDEVNAALADFNQAIRLNPKNAWAYVNRAIALDAKGDSDAALRDLDLAIGLDPHDAIAFHNRGTIRLKRKEYEVALKEFAHELELDPQDSDAHAGRAAAFRRLDQSAKALEECNLALARNPNSVMAYIERAKAHAALKRYAEAEKDLEAITHLTVKWPGATFNSPAWIHATHPNARMRDGRKAIAEATRACELSGWKQWSFIGTLAAAYAEVGDFEQAIKFQEQALKIAPPENELLPKAKERLNLYRKHKPCRDE